jgi:hypothetical protein
MGADHPMNLEDAHQLVSQSAVLLQRLRQALAELASRPGFADEKAWLAAAVERVAEARSRVGTLGDRVMRLPELEALRGDHLDRLQHDAVDAVEKLQAGVTFHGGPRHPLVEAVFGKLKLPLVRRADQPDFQRFAAELEKKLDSAYARRMLAEPALAAVQPAVDEVRAGFASWRDALSSEALPEAEARALRDELEAVARDLELPCRQARLLAEAALAPVKGLYEASGLAARAPRRRAPKSTPP